MKQLGPQLDALTHRLAECPAEFYQSPLEVGPGPARKADAVNITAIAGDHLRDMHLAAADRNQALEQIASADAAHQRLAAIAIWLLHDEWFLAQGAGLASAMARLLVEGIRPLAATIRPELTVTDPDRREELARLCLAGLGYRPAGESIEQATDRLNTLDSVEREQVVRKTRAAEARARRIREEMVRRRAEEAAVRYSPE